MKRLIVYILIIGVFSLLSSCKKNRPAYTDTQVRILNTTAWTLNDCTVDPFGTFSQNPGPYSYNYGQVNVNSNSHYRAFEKIHRYSWVRLTMNNKTYYLTPYDYIGETPLSHGRYTYKISYDAATDRLGLELVNDWA